MSNNAFSTKINGIGAIFTMHSEQIIRKQTDDENKFDTSTIFPTLENKFLQSSALLNIDRSTIKSL